MITRVNRGGDKSGGFSISSSDCKQGRSYYTVSGKSLQICYEVHNHDVGLRTKGDQTVYVLINSHQALSRHMSTLLGPWSLIFNMNTSSTLLDEQLCQLHDRGQASMAGVSIRNNGSQVIYIGEFGTLCFRLGTHTLLSLLAIVEELCHEEVSYLVWDRGLAKVNTCFKDNRRTPYSHMDNLPNLGQARP